MSEKKSGEKRPKVLMVELHSPGNRYVLELARQMKNYCDLTVFCKTGTPFQVEGTKWIDGFYGGGRGKIGAVLAYGKSLMDLRRLIVKERFDVIHLHSFKKADVEMKLYLRLQKYYKALVMTVHNALPHEPKPGDEEMYRRFYHRCDLLIGHNDATRQVLKEQFGIADEKIAVIPRGLYETYEPARADSADGKKHFLCFGRIRHYKGVDILIRAIELLPEEERNKCRFTIRGEQFPQLDQTDYADLIRKAGIGPWVDFSNQRVPEEEIPALLGSAHAVIFPYRKIYGSGVLLMAYTFQVPVIASDIPSFTEGTDGGKTGLLFASESPEALRDAILKAIAWDADTVETYRRNIRELVERRHSWRFAAEQTAAGYRRVLEEKA